MEESLRSDALKSEADGTFTDLLYPPPTSENSLPHVTCAMLADHLVNYEMLTPPRRRRGEHFAGTFPCPRKALHAWSRPT